MEIKTKQVCEGKIDWERVMEYTKEIFPELKSNLEEALFNLQLQESELDIEINKYPPRISIEFLEDAGLEEEKEKELKINQEKISLIIEELATKNNLEAKAGTFSSEPRREGKATYCKRIYNHDIGRYTLQPFYKEFIVK